MLGYRTANMDSIADAAGVSKRTVYKHFEDKQALFGAVVRTLCASVVPPPLEEFCSDKKDTREVLVALGIHILSNLYSKDQVALFRIVVADAQHFPELGKLMFDQVLITERMIREYLAHEQGRGNLKLPCPEIAASQFLGLLKTDMQLKLLFRQRKRVTQEEIRKIANCCVQIFLDGVSQKHRR